MNRLELIAKYSPRRGAEVGTLNGDFAYELLVIPTLQELYVIDAWKHFEYGPYTQDVANVGQAAQDERERQVRARFKGNARIHIMKELSTDAANRFQDDELDFVYIDAAHDKDSVLCDLLAWSTKTRRIFLHDFTQRPEAVAMGFGVIYATDVFLRVSPHNWRVKYITQEEWPTAMLEREG